MTNGWGAGSIYNVVKWDKAMIHALGGNELRSAIFHQNTCSLKLIVYFLNFPFSIFRLSSTAGN